MRHVTPPWNVASAAQVDAIEPNAHDQDRAQESGSSHFGVWGVVLAWGRGLPDD